jgi:hypothetical protein
LLDCHAAQRGEASLNNSNIIPKTLMKVNLKAKIHHYDDKVLQGIEEHATMS